MFRQFFFRLLICSLLSSRAASQQPDPQTLSFMSTGAYSLSHADFLAAIRQTAALANLRTPGVGVAGIRPFLLTGSGRYCMQAAVPLPSGTAGLKADLTGGMGCSTTQLGLAYARNLGTKLSAGLCFNYQQIRIPGYGEASAPGVEAGVILRLTRELQAGVQCINPVSGKWGAGKMERLPAIYVMGFGYEASAIFYCSAEIIKEEEQPAIAAVSFQYKPHARFILRAGMNTGTAVTWAGAGFQFSRCRFDLFVSFHPQLGITPGTGVLFYFKKKAV